MLQIYPVRTINGFEQFMHAKKLINHYILNFTIFWDISKWNRGQKKWDGGSIFYTNLMCACGFRRKNKKQKTKN